MEIGDFFADTVHKEVSQTLNDKVLSTKYTDINAPIINHWISDGLLDDIRDDSKKWRRFSIIEAVWVAVVNELRNIGLSKDRIKRVKEVVLATNSNFETSYPYLEYHLMVSILYKKPYYIVIDSTGETNILSLEAYMQWLKTGNMANGHIVFLIGSLYEKVLHRMDTLQVEFGEFFKLTKEELELLSFIKQNDFQTIKITRKQGEIDRLEGIERIDRDKRIIDILKEGDYQNIELKQENGKVVCIHRTIKKKISKQ